MTHTPAPVSDSASNWPTDLNNDPSHLLVVDDEEAVRRYAARILQQDGFVVHQAADGFEALELIESGTLPIELVISDIMMPRLNGVELMKALAVSYPSVPVILISAYARGELAEMGVAAPCGVLPKPFPADRLLEAVRRCLSRSQ